MEEARLVEDLLAAGFAFRGWDGTPGALPVDAAWEAVSCRSEDGRRDLTVEVTDPQLLGKANSAWFQLACECNLWRSEEREFLLGVDIAEDGDDAMQRWARVRLMDEWDVMGVGAESHLFGWGSGCPEFIMMSLSGDVVLNGTTWGNRDIGVLAVPHPERARPIRACVEYLAANREENSYIKTMATDWLIRNAT
jgi:hypothetical protein